MAEGRPAINNHQLRAIIVCTMWPTVINYASGMVARRVGRDMWLSGIISVLCTAIFLIIMVGIGRSFPGKTIVVYSQELLTTIPGKLVGFILSVFFFVATANTVSMYIHHLTDFLLPETPFLVVTILHVGVVSFLILKGPEVIARMGVIGFSLAIVFYLLVFLASLSEVEFRRLLPFFESGFFSVSKASISIDSFIGINQILIGMLLPMLADDKKAYKASLSGLFIGGFFFVFYFIVELMVMGPQVVALMRIASMDFVRSIQITQYLHRFESFMVGLWYWSMLVQAGILGYCSLKAMLQTLGIKKEKKRPVLTIGFGIGTIALTYFIANDRILFLNFRETSWQYFSLPIQYGLPVILLIAFMIRNLAGGGKKKTSEKKEAPKKGKSEEEKTVCENEADKQTA